MTPAEARALLLRQPARTGVFSDFDGTLAPIVGAPDSARPLDGAADVLVALAAQVAAVGVVSGRPAAFLAAVLGPAATDHLSLWGLHGLVTVVDGRVVATPEAAPWRPVVREAVQRAQLELAGVADVEDKDLSVTIHFRRNPAGEPQVTAWVRRAGESTGLAVHPARMSYELRPPVPHGKGMVLETVASTHDLTVMAFFGDDIGDADAFAALGRLSDERGLQPVRVAVASDEAADVLLDQADLVLDGPPAVLELLRELSAGPAAEPR